jgi:hypothetical protein
MSSQSDVSAINDAIRDPVPELRESEGLIVTLQRGIVDPASGIWHTEAEVREMTGEDEEYMSGIEAKGTLTYSDYMVALLKRTVVRIGTLDIATNHTILDNISIGDRNILFLGVVKATYGKLKEFQATCVDCSKDNDVVMDLDDDFPLQEAEVDLRAPISIKLRNGKVVKLRIPTTGDSATISKKAHTASEQNTLMISKCAVWEDTDRPKDVEKWAKSLNVADRNKMVKAILDVKAGPKLEEVKVPCAHCDQEMIIRIDWISLLLS